MKTNNKTINARVYEYLLTWAGILIITVCLFNTLTAMGF